LSLTGAWLATRAPFGEKMPAARLMIVRQTGVENPWNSQNSAIFGRIPGFSIRFTRD
jgi:hypothetical protein